ncbi:MAG: DUF333 domain-containing protein [Methanomicrobiales archaeon]|jgi:putative hemolysin|nr:DUF333 domain-containing protein [Methanomicrobiales archaeon]
MKSIKPVKQIGIILLVLCMVLIPSVVALKNPAAVYAEALGYQYVTMEEKGAGMRGFVVLPDGARVSGWDFLKGKAGEQYSACAQLGGKQTTVKDKQLCSAIYSDTCAVCELPNGTRAEVTVLLKLDFSESICGDGTCGMPENEKTCPEDCPKDGMDEYCGGGAQDPDCIGDDNWTPPPKE